MNRLMIRLWGIIEGESTDSINYQIAKTLITNISKIHHASSSELAKLCNVSKPSISRFCKLIGYDDFYDFRAELIQFFPDRGVKYHLKGNNKGDWIAQYLDEVVANMVYFQDEAFQKQLKDLIKDIVEYDCVYLLGNMQSGKTATNLYSNIHNFKASVSSVTSFQDQKNILEHLKDHTLYIIFSVSGEFFRVLLNEEGVKRDDRNASIWLVTANPLINKVKGVDKVLNCKTGSDLASSNISLEIIGNLLALGVWYSIQES